MDDYGDLDGVGGKRETPTLTEFPKFPRNRWEKKGAGVTFENDKKRGVSLNDLSFVFLSRV